MKITNKKGFTLIELLAVIVILAILLGIAIPAVSQYINSSRKSGFVDNVKMFVDAARNASVSLEFDFPSDAGHVTVITFEQLKDHIEKNRDKSSYGGKWTSNSFVVIAQEGTNERPKYVYYVAANDGKYSLGDAAASPKAQIVAVDDLGTDNVVRESTGASIPRGGNYLHRNKQANKAEYLTITSSATYEEAGQTKYNLIVD